MLATRASAQRGATREVRGATRTGANATRATGSTARLKGYRATCVWAFAVRLWLALLYHLEIFRVERS